jgi:TolB protein
LLGYLRRHFAGKWPKCKYMVIMMTTAENDASPLRIIMTGFVTEDPADREIADKIEETITADLRRDPALEARGPSDRGSPFDTPSAILNPPPAFEASGVPRFAYWRGLGAKALFTGKLTREGDGRLKIETRLWDVVGGRHLSGQQYRVEPAHWRQIGHIIADTIYTRLTGRDGRFEADNPE